MSVQISSHICKLVMHVYICVFQFKYRLTSVNLMQNEIHIILLNIRFNDFTHLYMNTQLCVNESTHLSFICHAVRYPSIYTI